MSDALGSILGSYRLEALLGTGSVGQVYRGTHLQSGRAVAIKVLHAHVAHDPGFQARFRQEAAAVDTLQHPNVVDLIEFGEQDERYYLVMELVTGGSLRSLLQQRGSPGLGWSFPEGPDFVRQAAEGLAYAHGRRMVHRDVKPDNLLLQRTGAGPAAPAYVVKVSDFGLVRMAERSTLTVTGVVMGTPDYMSPEQCQGAPLDGRSDIYSLGIVLYEVATGLLPFEIRSLREAYDRHVHVPPIPPRQALPDLSPRLEEIILRCLAKRPADRYQSAAALAADLQALVGPRGTPVGAEAAARPQSGDPIGQSRPTEPPPPRRPGVLPWETVQGTAEPRLQVQGGPGSGVRELAIPERGVTVGRGRDNDLVLEGNDVSRHHLRIDWDGQRASVTDLGSTNGTVLTGNRLLPNETRHLSEADRVQVGSYAIRLLPTAPGATPPRRDPGTEAIVLDDAPSAAAGVVSTAAAAGLASPPAGAGLTAPPTPGMAPPEAGLASMPAGSSQQQPAPPARRSGATEAIILGEVDRPGEAKALPADSDRIRLLLEQTALTITPGEPSSVSVTLANLGSTVDHFRLSVAGVPPTWVQGPADEVKLNPRGRETVTLLITAPRTCSTRAATYPVMIQAHSRENESEVGSAAAQWRVLPFTDGNLSLPRYWQRGWTRASYDVVVQNDGNAPAIYALTGKDDKQKLRYRFQPEKVQVAPCEQALVKLTLRAPRRLVGKSEPCRFTVAAAAAVGDQPLTTSGEFVQNAIDPKWVSAVPAALAILFVLLKLTLAPVIEAVTVSPTSAIAGQDTVVVKWNVHRASRIDIQPWATARDPGPDGQGEFPYPALTPAGNTVLQIKASNLWGNQVVTAGPVQVVTATFTPTVTPTVTPTPAPTATPTVAPTPSATTVPGLPAIQLAVSCEGPPGICDVSPSGQTLTIRPGQTVKLSWTVTNVEKDATVTLENIRGGYKLVDSFVDKPAASTDYKLTVNNHGIGNFSVVHVQVVPPTSTATATSTPTPTATHTPTPTATVTPTPTPRPAATETPARSASASTPPATGRPGVPPAGP